MDITTTLQKLHAAGARSITTAMILTELYERGDQTMSHLADRCQVSRSNISIMVERLVKKGLVRRFQTKSNRRRVFVDLTDEGEETIRPAMEHTS